MVGTVGPRNPSPKRDYRPPRDTRPISAFTIRSTRPGRLSSSQDFSIGRSISLTRSSRVRALLLSTVWASVLKADSTAETGGCERLGGQGRGRRHLEGRRLIGGGPVDGPGCGRLREFEIVLRLDLVERGLRRWRGAHH